MEKLTASNIVSFINQLPKNQSYNYIHPGSKGLITIEHVELPEGPIKIKRFDPHSTEDKKSKSRKTAKEESISSEMIWRYANAFQVGLPVNVDRVFGASYNTRSVLESLLAHTPQFYFAYPGRIERIAGKEKTKKGHKHLIWRPDDPHRLGKITKTKTDIVISEIPSNVVYDAIVLPTQKSSISELDIEIQRRHAQIQVALYKIGKQLGFRTWIARNDKSIIYKNKRLGESEGVISSLNDEQLLMGFSSAVKAALLIDCIWFRNAKFMPAVMEIEHTTGVTSGLSRMKNFQDEFIDIRTRYVVVASDDERNKVVQEANKEQFKKLDTRFFSYSAVEELYSLCQRRKIKGVNDDFLDCFMEPVVSK